MAGGGANCGTATLTASGGTGGTIYYEGSLSGGTLTNDQVSSLVLNTNGTYYFRSQSADGCWGGEGSAAITINPLPTAVTVTGGGPTCGTATLIASNGGSGNIYYQATTSNGISTATGTLISTKTVSTSGTYYFRAKLGSCWGAEGSAIVVIGSVPAAVTVTGNGTYCGNATLTATGGAGGAIYYQGSVSGGTDASDQVSSKVVTTTGLHYFRAMSAGGCWGPQGSANVSISPMPGAVTVTGGGAFCGSALLTASNDGSGTIFFEGTTPNNTVTTSLTSTQTVTASGTYFFRAKAGPCWSPEGSVTVTIQIVPSITGSLGLCIGGAIDLNSNTGGGAWSSGGTGIATVDAGTGLVASVAGPGTENIQYTGANGCIRTVEVTVSILAPNTGTPIICMGSIPSSIAILSNDAPGGAWSCLQPGKALISPSSGAIKGLNPGTATIVYSLGGCNTSTQITINPEVADIVGPAAVNTPATIFLSNTTIDGVWSSSTGNVSLVPGPPTTVAVTGEATGPAIIRYMVNPGCFKEKAISVNGGRPGMKEEDESQAQNFSVYPNPSTGVFMVQTSTPGTLTLYNMADGKMIMRYAITRRNSELALPSDMAAGVYVCNFTDEKGRSEVAKLMYKR